MVMGNVETWSVVDVFTYALVPVLIPAVGEPLISAVTLMRAKVNWLMQGDD